MTTKILVLLKKPLGYPVYKAKCGTNGLLQKLLKTIFINISDDLEIETVDENGKKTWSKKSHKQKHHKHKKSKEEREIYMPPGMKKSG